MGNNEAGVMVSETLTCTSCTQLINPVYGVSVGDLLAIINGVCECG